MIAGRFDPRELLQRADTVALLVPASELFGLLKRSFDLPAAWAALVRHHTGEYGIVPAGGCINGADAEDVVFARTTPIDLNFDVDALPSRDVFQCRAHVHLRLRLIPERSELVSFLNAILGSYRLATVTTLIRRAEPLVRDALLRLASQTDAADLVDGTSGENGGSTVKASVEPLCFSAGMTMDGPITIRFSSGTFQQVRQAQEEASRRRHEQEAARQVREAMERAQSQHLDHLSVLLKRLSELAAQAPQAGLLADDLP
jgi:hypothetical protein